MDKVLIVDDDPIFLDRLREELQKYVGQFRLVTATNGAEAIEIMEKERISVLITDLDMPQIDGLELLAHMRKHRPQIPCVVMTEPKTPDVEDKADRDSIFRYIAKPFGADQLFVLIMEGLERLDEGLFWREHRNK
ncbi:MAG: response regulator [Desulfobacterales bacterium]|nr:response regulator [Desulfobacterales bacterium]